MMTKGLADTPAITTMPGKEEKIRNAICFFASEHEKLTGKPLAHNFLYKYLAFLDFASLEGVGRAALGLLSCTMGRGPVPIGIYGKCDKPKDDRFVYVARGEGRYIVKATREPELSCFSAFELNEMKRLVETHARHFAEAFDTGGVGHMATGFSTKAWHNRKDEFINYGDVFDDDFFTKQKEVRIMSGLQLLTEKYVTQLKDLETRMVEIKHKLETVMEASRLLEEEGLSEDGPPMYSDENRA
jgi:hypothetical protein